MRIYLDNCCYNRPFDEQTQLRIRLETEAKLAIQRQMRMGVLEYVWSDMLANEVDESKFWEWKDKIAPWIVGCSMYVQTLVDAFGDVDAERFITLTIREPQDYTEWRRRNMYVGERVHEVAERARESGARLREQYGVSL